MENTTIHINGLITSSETNEKVLKIAGYAAHWDVPNLNGEVVHKDSFNRFLTALKDNGQMPAMTVYHNSEKVVGKWTLIEARDEGLYVEGELYLENSYVANEIAPLIRNGALKSLSTEGFSKMDENDINNDGSVTINHFTLTAISIVSVPADLEAQFETKNRINKAYVNTGETPIHIALHI